MPRSRTGSPRRRVHAPRGAAGDAAHRGHRPHGERGGRDLLGTLMTIRFRPVRWLIRFYVEVWRGLPILVTVLFIYWLPAFDVGSSTSS